jgi:hypothetical protein
MDQFLADIGYPTPEHANPADQAISVVNTEFYNINNGVSASKHLDTVANAWIKAEPKYNVNPQIEPIRKNDAVSPFVGATSHVGDAIQKTWILTQRNFLNYGRNLLAFGIRSLYHPVP